MSFELPLTALAMEIAGTAARAVGAGQTLTFPPAACSDTEELFLAALDVAALDLAGPARGCVTFAVSRLSPPAITVTL